MNSNQQNLLPKDYFEVQNQILKWLGITFTARRSLFIKIYVTIPIIISSTYTVFVLGDAFRPPTDLNEISTNVFYGTGVGTATIKHLIICINRLKLREIMDTLENDPYLYHFKYRDATETAWIRECVDFTRIFCLAGETISVVSILINIVATGFLKSEDGSRILPFGKISFLQEITSYETVFVFQSIALIIGAFTHMTSDIVYATAIAHICVQLKILKAFVGRICQISEKMMLKENGFQATSGINELNKFDASNSHWVYLEQMLKEAVNYHLTVLDTTVKLNEMFSIIMLAEFISMSIAICFILYHASMYQLTDLRVLKDFTILITALTPIILMCYWGNEVTLRSQAVANACYEMDFVGTDVRFQKSLALIIQRSQRPIGLTIGKFATLSLITLVSFCRACYSYYMVLRRSNIK